MFNTLITKKILGNFFKIELTATEKKIAIGSIETKYAKTLARTLVYIPMTIPAILFLDTSVIMSALIPITMVAGTAWFSISLANMKQKFEDFGSELTKDMFEAFTISLGLLLTLSIFSLSLPLWQKYTLQLPHQNILQLISFILATIVITNIIYRIFIGSMKYDINDAMLTGQNEAAERFYRKSLSLLHSVSSSLRSGKSIQVANYYIGVAFFEIFSYLKTIDIFYEELTTHIDTSNTLIKNPSMPQEQADIITINLIRTFITYCTNPQGHSSHKSLEAISDELDCLTKNKDESQEMADTRFAMIFQEIASLLEGQGETLFNI